jgi:ACS family hexuronate transporter-like MFS transporter
MTVQAQAASQRRIFTYENALVVILGLTFGVVFFDRQAASNLMPFIKPDLGLNETQVGLIGSALSATWAISAYLIGLLSDRTGRRKSILIACVVGFSVCSAISGLAPNYNILLASRFLMGMLEGGVMPICLAIMTLESSESRRGLNAGIVQNGFSNLVGNSAGPIILVAIATMMTWRDAFYLAAVPGLLCAIAIMLWVKEPPKEVHHSEDGSHKMPLLAMFRVRNVLVCSGISVFMVAWLVTGFAFLPVVLTELSGFTKSTTANLMGVLGFCAFFSGALLPGLSDRIGRKPVLITGCFAGALTSIAVLYFHGPIFILATLMFIGWVGNGIFPMFMGTVPGESLPRQHIATAMGIVVGVGEILGGVCGPFIAGRIADTTSLGLQAPMVLMIAFTFIAGCIALFLKETAPAKTGTPPHEPMIPPTTA